MIMKILIRDLKKLTVQSYNILIYLQNRGDIVNRKRKCDVAYLYSNKKSF